MEQTDPLHLAPAALDPELAYQWFRVSIMGQPDSTLACRAQYWDPVLRVDMPREPSTSDEFIERGALRLYARPKAVSRAMSQEATDEALEQVRILDQIMGHVPYDRPAPAKRTLAPAEWQYVPRPHKLLTWFDRHPRGILLTIHEDKLGARAARCLAPLLKAHQYRLTRLRVIYLPRGETEMADYMHLSYATWGWGKIDSVRSGDLPSYRTAIVRPRRVIHLHFSCPSARALGTKLRSTWNRIFNKTR